MALLLVATMAQAQQQEIIDSCPKDTVNGEEVYKYQVPKSIGLYRIGINFNVSQSEIVRMNPQLKERGLHYGETILIPTGKKVEKAEKEIEKVEIKTDAPIAKPAIAPEVKTTVSAQTTPEIKDTVSAQPVVAGETRTIELALMLPFESQQTKRSNNADKMMEFYQGVLLALHDLQNDSTKYRLRVYDTERSERKVVALCDSTELDSVQAILGLAYPIQIERMAEWCDLHKVSLLVPFCDEIDLTNHSQLLQFNAGDLQEADSLCRWIKQRDMNCVAIEVREAELAASVRTLRKQMKAAGISTSALALRDLMNDSVVGVLSKDKENLIILHSDKFNQVRLALPHLEALKAAGYRIRILSQYSWQKESINLPQVYTSMFTEIGDTEAYEALWNQYFGNTHASDAPRYDLLGYDLLNALVQYLDGKTSYQGLQAKVELVRLGANDGWQNTQVRIVEK